MEPGDEKQRIDDETIPFERGDRIPMSSLPSPPETPIPENRRIGKFELLDSLGTGGFGDVYRAMQYEPVEREVALKLLKPGMDTREIIRRFESERQALALMEHPNIARVLDGGETPSGHPYFVMELVRGSPITDYCDEKKLGIRERLAIFRQVCAGVQHAHQKGVIHRDLKPSNILVEESDGKPIPKVIDFGVAKAVSGDLSEQSLMTVEGQLIGTPQYMSPEQAAADIAGIDTRSDIYALGIILYELLTGEPPLTRDECRDAGYVAVAGLIREKTPARPSSKIGIVSEPKTVTVSRGSDISALRRILKQDLDWVVMKALEKERDRRYESASAFSDDIRRYLTHQPVVASPPSRVYRLKKFARRQRGTLFAGAAVFLALILGAVVSIWQAVRAYEESERAQMAERQSALQRDAANAVNLISTEPRRSQEIMARVAEESDLLFGELSPPVVNSLVTVLDGARETFFTNHRDVRDSAVAREAGLVVSVKDTTCFLTDLREGRQRARFAIRSDTDNRLARCVAITRSGGRMVVGYDDGSAAVFDTASGTESARWTVVEGASPLSVRFFGENEDRAIFLDGEGELSRWDLSGAEPTLIGERRARDAAINPEIFACDAAGEIVITAGFFGENPGFSLIDRAKGASEAPVFIETPGKVVSAVAVRADGTQFLTGHDDGTVQLWDRNGTPAASPILAHRSTVWGVAFLAGMEQLASSSQQGETRIWGLAGEAMSGPMASPSGVVTLSPLDGGRYLVGMGANGSIRAWDTIGARARPGILSEAKVEQFLFPRTRPDEMLVCLQDGRVQVLEWQKSGRVLRERTVGRVTVQQMRLDRAEKTLAVMLRGDPRIHLLDFPSLDERQTINLAGAAPNSIAFIGESDESLAVRRADGGVDRIDLRSGAVHEIGRVGESANPSVEIIRLARPHERFTHLITDAKSGRSALMNATELRLATPRGITAIFAVETSERLAFARENQVWFGESNEGLITVADAARGSLPVFQSERVEDIDWSSTGSALIVGGKTGHLKLINTAGEPLSPDLIAHRIGVEAVAAHPDQPIAVSSGHDRWIRFWGTHPSVWRERLDARVSGTAKKQSETLAKRITRPAATRSDFAQSWEDAIVAPEIGFAMRARSEWEAAPRATVVAFDSLVKKGMGELYKRAKFHSIHFGPSNADQSFFLSDMVVVIEIPEFVNPEGFASRVDALLNHFGGSVNQRLGNVFRIDDDGKEMKWREDRRGGLNFAMNLVYPGKRVGRAEGFWIPTLGSTVVVAAVSSHDTSVAGDAERQETFLAGVREQVGKIVIHETSRPDAERLAAIHEIARRKELDLARGIGGEGIRQLKVLLSRYAKWTRPDEERLIIADEMVALARREMEASKENSLSALGWAARLHGVMNDRADRLISLGRIDEAVAMLEEATSLSADPFNEYRTIDIRAKIAEKAGKFNRHRDLCRLLVAAQRRWNEGSQLADDPIRLAQSLLRLHSAENRLEPGSANALDALDEAEAITDEACEVDETRASGLWLRIQLLVVREKNAEKRENQGELRRLLEVQLEAARAGIALRPTSIEFFKTELRASIQLCRQDVLAGELDHAVKRYQEVLDESDDAVFHFAGQRIGPLWNLSDSVVTSSRSLFAAMSEDGLNAERGTLQVALIETIERWPEAVKKTYPIGLQRINLRRDLVSFGLKKLDFTVEDCESRLSEAHEIARDILTVSKPEEWETILRHFFSSVLERRDLFDNTLANAEKRRKIFLIGHEMMSSVISEKPDREWRWATYENFVEIATGLMWVERKAGAYPVALEYARESVRWKRRMMALKEDYPGLVHGLKDLAYLQEHTGADEETVRASFEEALSIAERGDDADIDVVLRCAEVLKYFAHAEMRFERWSEAEDRARSAIEDVEMAIERRPDELSYRIRLGEMTQIVALAIQNSESVERFPEAIKFTERAVEVRRDILDRSTGSEEAYEDALERSLTLLESLETQSGK